MEGSRYREAESVFVPTEEEKSLPFRFPAPRLRLRVDKTEGRIDWESRSQIIADNRTYLVSSWMAVTDAERKLQTLLADLGKGTSWLNMYKMTAEACEAIQRLPHNFAMPKVEPHPLIKRLLATIGNRGAGILLHTGSI